MTRYTAAYANEIAAFVAAVAEGAAPPTTGHDGLMALALADAAGKIRGRGPAGEAGRGAGLSHDKA